MIQCAYFYDSEFDRWNGKVVANPAVNVTTMSEQEMKDQLLGQWNLQNPGEPATAEDFIYQETSPW